MLNSRFVRTSVSTPALRRGVGSITIHAAFIGAVLAAVAVTSCQSGSSLPAGSADVRAGEGRRNATLTMTGTLHVELLGNSGTGYDWRLAANDPSLFEPIGSPHLTPLDPGVTGGRTITTFQFRPLRPGKTTLVFEYVQPWLTNSPPGRVVQIEATVAGGGS